EGGYAPLGLPRPALGRAPAEPWRASMTASPATPLLELENVEVVYHRVATAVQGVSLRVPERSIVALLGTNGAGKTTTLRAVSGFLGGDDARVVAGRIVFRGEVITGRMPHEAARRRLRDELGTAVLLVEQNAAAALAVADAGYVLEHGRIVYDGSVERLLAHEDIREFYLGVGHRTDRVRYTDVKQYRRRRRWF